MKNLKPELYTELFYHIRRVLRYKIDNQVSNKVDRNLVVGIWGKLDNSTFTQLNNQLNTQLELKIISDNLKTLGHEKFKQSAL